MLRTYPVKIPADSLISKALNRVDYQDNFSILIPSEKAIPVEALPTVFFEAMPKWFTYLIGIREFIAKAIGLKTAQGMNVEKQLADFRGEVGQSIALFEVLGRTKEEIMVGENDSHLDFRLSYIAKAQEDTTELSLATIVQFNNWIGKLYFVPVGPIHRLIVPIILKRMAKVLISK